MADAQQAAWVGPCPHLPTLCLCCGFLSLVSTLSSTFWYDWPSNRLALKMVKSLLTMRETWVGKIPWRRKWQPTPVFLPGESHGQRSLANYNPRGCKESDMTEQLHFYFQVGCSPSFLPSKFPLKCPSLVWPELGHQSHGQHCLWEWHGEHWGGHREGVWARPGLNQGPWDTFPLGKRYFSLFPFKIRL